MANNAHKTAADCRAAVPVILAVLLVALAVAVVARPAMALAIGGQAEATAGVRIYDENPYWEDPAFRRYVLKLWVPMGDNLRTGIGLVYEDDFFDGESKALLFFVECEPAETLSIYVGYAPRVFTQDGRDCDVWIRYESGPLWNTGIRVRAAFHLDYGLRVSGSIGYFDIDEELIGGAWLEPLPGLGVGAGAQYDILRDLAIPIAFVEYEAFGAVSLRYEHIFRENGYNQAITMAYTF